MAARQWRKKNYVHFLMIYFSVSSRILMTQIEVTNIRNKMHDHSEPKQSIEPQRKKRILILNKLTVLTLYKGKVGLNGKKITSKQEKKCLSFSNLIVQA